MNWWPETEEAGNLSMPPVDTALTKCVHRPVSLSLVLTPVPLLVKGVSGNIKDEEEFFVWEKVEMRKGFSPPTPRLWGSGSAWGLSGMQVFISTRIKAGNNKHG